MRIFTPAWSCRSPAIRRWDLPRLAAQPAAPARTTRSSCRSAAPAWSRSGRMAAARVRRASAVRSGPVEDASSRHRTLLGLERGEWSTRSGSTTARGGSPSCWTRRGGAGAAPGPGRHRRRRGRAAPAGRGVAFEVRAFFPKDGATVEDPVTGSLNASLAQWLLQRPRRGTYVAGQGTALGRAGRVHVPRRRREDLGRGGDLDPDSGRGRALSGASQRQSFEIGRLST